jgi:peptidoglycan/LPS O-acetylase OafA/YrhL
VLAWRVATTARGFAGPFAVVFAMTRVAARFTIGHRVDPQPRCTPDAGPGGARAVVAQAGELRSAAIESLRALAALAVVEAHVFGASVGFDPYRTMADWGERALLGGGFGVYVFFGLSGYLLYRPFARQIIDPGRRVLLRRYAANRAARILPLYYVVIATYLAVLDHGGNPGLWWRFGLFAQSFFHRTVATVDGPAWSLVVEVQFYLLLPLVALGLRLLARGRPARPAVALAALGLLSELMRLELVLWSPAPNPLWQYSFPVTFVFFVPGMLLALTETAWRGAPPAWLRGPLSSADLWVLAAAGLFALTFWHYNDDLAVAGASFLLVGSVALPLRRGLAARLLEWRPLAVVGTASYSLYLWHLPIVVWFVSEPFAPHGFLPLVGILLPCTVLVALASYALVEAPFLRLRRRWAPDAPPHRPTQGRLGRLSFRLPRPAGATRSLPWWGHASR